MKSLVIIGAGFSGTMTAVHLIRNATAPFRLHMVAGRKGFARGAAYSTWSDKHLLNVTAAGMSAFADRPDHFTDWVTNSGVYRDTDRGLIASAFLPRNLYGEYLESIWEETLTMARVKGIVINRIDLAAVALDASDTGYNVHLEDHSVLGSDLCIIATGNNAPSCPSPVSPVLSGNPRFVSNPWEMDPGLLPERDQPVLIIGNGLTMADTVTGLLDNGFKGIIHTISRHGFSMLPHRHADVAYSNAAAIVNGTGGLHGLAGRIFDQIRTARRFGYTPEPVVNSLRPHVQSIWQGMTNEEKQLFYNRLRPFWDLARHRIPAHVRERILELAEEGKVKLHSGNLTEAAGTPAGISVHYCDKKTNESRTLEVSAVINCTGPAANIAESENLLLKDGLSKGYLVQDNLRLGIEADPITFKVIDNHGRAQERLRTLGPPLKGVLWETTAVREIRVQAEALARNIITSMSL